MPTAVTLIGRLDDTTCIELRRRLGQALEAAGDKSIDVDLRAVTYIDDAALDALVVCRQRAAAAGGRLGFIGISSAVVDVLERAEISYEYADISVPGQ